MKQAIEKPKAKNGKHAPTSPPPPDALIIAALGVMGDELYPCVREAARSGDGEALRKLLGGVLATDEGRRLAKQLRELMEK